MMEIYEKLKDIRNSKNISTYELANITGISQSTISKIENGKRKLDIDMLTNIAKGLEVSVESLFKDKLQYIDEIESGDILYDYYIKTTLEETEQYKRTKEEKASVEQVFIVDRLLELGLSFEEALDYGQITEEDYKYLTSDRLKRLTTVLHLVEE